MLKLERVIGSGVAPAVDRGERTPLRPEVPLPSLVIRPEIKGTTKTLWILAIPLDTKKLKGCSAPIPLN